MDNTVTCTALADTKGETWRINAADGELSFIDSAGGTYVLCVLSDEDIGYAEFEHALDEELK